MIATLVVESSSSDVDALESDAKQCLNQIYRRLPIVSLLTNTNTNTNANTNTEIVEEKMPKRCAGHALVRINLGMKIYLGKLILFKEISTRQSLFFYGCGVGCGIRCGIGCQIRCQIG